jgi:hypothetical protein
MIVPSMSNEEIVKELLSDVEIVKRKAEYSVEEVRRMLIKTKAYPFIKAFDYVSPKTKNKWIYVLEINSKYDSFVTPVNYHYTDIGLRAAMVTSTGNIVLYTGHFFTRYSEREDLNILNPVDKMKDFFMLNPQINYKTERKLEDGVFEIFGTVTTGIVLGKKIAHNLMICNTYLSNELLKGNQILVSSEQKAELDYYIAMRKAGRI